MANKIKLRGTTEKVFELGNVNKQIFDATSLTANRTWLLPDSNGSSGYVLSTNGSGTLSWASPGSATPAGSNSEIQFNNSGAFGASSKFTFSTSSTLMQIGDSSDAGFVQIGSGTTDVGEMLISPTSITTPSGAAGFDGANFGFQAGAGGTGDTDGGSFVIKGGDGSGTGLGGVVLIAPGRNGALTETRYVSIENTGLDIRFYGNGEIRLNSDPGTTGQVLTSNGTGAPPTWENVGGSSGLTATQLYALTNMFGPQF